MGTTLLPTAKEVRDLYKMLLGRTVEVSLDYEILKPDGEFGCCVVFFNNAMGAVYAAYIMDLDLCVCAGVALQLISAIGAQDCISNGCLDGNYIENVHEVLSVLSSLFNKEGVPHVSVDLTHTPGEELPANEYKMVTSYVECRDPILDIEGYGRGRFGVVCPN